MIRRTLHPTAPDLGTALRTLRPAALVGALAGALAAGLALVVLAVPAAAQDADDRPPPGRTLLSEPVAPVPGGPAEDPWLVPRLDPSVVEGGRIPLSVWNEIPPLPMSQHVPAHGDEPSERTDIRMVHDGEAIYFLARMYDREPGRIQAPSLKRDQIPHTNDFFGILLDSFLDRETAHGFWTNPEGLRTDLLTQNDASAPGGFNYDWNGYWDVRPVVDDEGWRTEVRIPLSSLRFQPSGSPGEVTMGLIVYRRIPRKNEWITFPAIPRDDASAHFRPSNARPVVLRGVEEPSLLLITPYVLGGAERRYDARGSDGLPVDPGDAAPVTSWVPDDRGELDAGLDVKYGLTPNLTLDLTVNPDFAQVEADDQEVNLTRFSLFFPEKRLFFQERSSTFDFSYGGSERLFYTRRIGLDGGEPVDIIGGARVAGRVGEWNVGLLTAQTAASDALPTENHSVLRTRRTVLNENSYAGGILTSRLTDGGRYNLAWGADALLRLRPLDYLTLQWAHTADSEVDGAGFVESGLARVGLERRSSRGFLYDFNAKWVGPEHLPRLGFLRRAGYVQVGDEIGWGWTPGPDASYTTQTVRLGASALWRDEDGMLETAEVGPSWSVTTNGGYRFNAGANVQREDLRDPFTLPGGNLVEAGTHTFTRGSAGFGTPGGDLHGLSVSADAGGFYDGWSAGVSVRPRVQLGSHLELSGSWRWDRVRFPDRDGPGGTGPGLDAHVTRLRLDHQVSTALSWATFAQYNSTADGVTANFRLRFNPREGTDLYVVYNAGVNTDRDVLDPRAARLPLAELQTLVVKFSVTRNGW